MPVGDACENHCAKCRSSTNHKVLGEVIKSGEEIFDCGRNSIYWQDTYQIVSCLGCDSHSFRHEYYFSEDYDDGPTIKVFPEKEDRFPSEVSFPDSLDPVYRETILAYNRKAFTLCPIGLRALIEGICFNFKITSGLVTDENGGSKRKTNLEGKINGLHENGFITLTQVKALHGLRFLGNDAAHELEPPSKPELDIAIDLFEHILSTIFAVNGQVQLASQMKSTRKAKKKQPE